MLRGGWFCWEGFEGVTPAVDEFKEDKGMACVL